MKIDREQDRGKPVIAVIGGGPAGLMASISAAKQNTARIILFEKNAEPGRKLLLTGNGRCNLTNASEVRDFTEHVFEGAKFLRKALYAFSPVDTKEFFENLGVPVKTEAGGRVFPASDRAADILLTLVRAAESLDVELHRNEAVTQIHPLSGKKGFSIVTGRSSYFAAACILCAGGASYPATGSDGDSHRLAGDMGQPITPVRAGLSPIKLADAHSTGLPGVSLRGVRLRLLVKASKKAEVTGDILFTHIGISGPAVLRLSRYLPDDRSEYREGQVALAIGLMPGMSDEVFAKHVLRIVTENPNRILTNVCKDLAPEAYISFLLDRIHLSSRTVCRDLKKEERQRFVHALRHAEYPAESPPDFGAAMITVGGISTSKIKPGTMESMIVPGLYIAGEALDVDADTGGYNLQIAFSTGFVAGKQAATEIITKQ